MKIAFIYFNNVLVPAKISPENLISFKKQNLYPKANIFKTNPKKLIRRLSKAYNIKPKIYVTKENDRIINGQPATVLIKFEMNEINLSLIVFSQSVRSAYRKLARDIHRHYC